MKEKLRSYEFWVSLISAVLVVLQTMSLKVDIPHITEITTAFLGALSVAGILKKSKSEDEEEVEIAVQNNEDTDLNNVQNKDNKENKEDKK